MSACWRRATRAILVSSWMLGLLLSAPRAGAQTASKIVLVQPKFAAGDILLGYTRMMVAGTQTTSEKGTETSTSKGWGATSVNATRIVRTENDRPVETVVDQLAELTHEATEEIEDGQPVSRWATTHESLDGTSVRYSLRDGVWRGVPASDDQHPISAEDLEGYLPPYEFDPLPPHPVELGDSWTVDDARWSRFMPEGLEVIGQMECQFDRVVEHHGRPHALIVWRLDQRVASADDGPHANLQVSLSGKSWIDAEFMITTQEVGNGKLIGSTPEKNGKPSRRLVATLEMRCTTQKLRAAE